MILDPTLPCTGIPYSVCLHETKHEHLLRQTVFLFSQRRHTKSEQSDSSSALTISAHKISPQNLAWNSEIGPPSKTVRDCQCTARTVLVTSKRTEYSLFESRTKFRKSSGVLYLESATQYITYKIKIIDDVYSSRDKSPRQVLFVILVTLVTILPLRLNQPRRPGFDPKREDDEDSFL